MNRVDTLLEGLDEAQLAAVTSEAATLRILAGAGSGKTRVLTRRIAHRAATSDLDARRVLAITFTRKAAGELVTRLGSLGLNEEVTAGTFHSVAYTQLQIHWADKRVTAPAVIEQPLAFIERLLASHGLNRPESTRGSDQTTSLLASEITWAKAKLVDPGSYASRAARAGRRTELDPELIAAVFEHYEDEKRSRHVIDLSDLLSLYRRALEGDATFRRAQHWKFRHLFIDEFQDLNPAQNAVLEALVGERDDLCVVGDPNQAIYSFNGADPGLLAELVVRYPGTETVVLRRNYRSTAPIVDTSGSLLGSDRPVAATVSTAPHAPEHIPTITSHPDEAAEAEAIAAAIASRTDGDTPLSAQAVLVRTNAQIAAITRALTDRGISFEIRRDQSTRPELGSTASRGESRRAQRDAVEISTFHAAKGLEWPVVHVAGMEDGLVPIAHATTPEQSAEERRLLYVAMSRAGRELHLSWSQTRGFGRRRMNRRRSPHLDTIESAVRALRPKSPRTGSTARAAARRSRTRQADPHPRRSDLLDDLRGWRSARAKAAGVPTYVIFHDATLDALAESSPTTRDDLLSITGIGQVKASRYGDDLLAIIAKHATCENS